MDVSTRSCSSATECGEVGESDEEDDGDEGWFCIDVIKSRNFKICWSIWFVAYYRDACQTEIGVGCEMP